MDYRGRVYHFYSHVTGELVGDIFDVVRAILWDYCKHNILNLNWEFSEKGF